MKTLDNISWQVDEATYRADSNLSYSTLVKFQREGLHKIDQLFDKVETPSLTFGSAVDAIITGGQEEFENRFVVANITLDDETTAIIKAIYDLFNLQFDTFSAIPLIQVSEIAKQNGFWPADKWSAQARYNGLLKKGDIEGYYRLLKLSEGKTVISTDTYQEVVKCVSALKTSDATRFYFAETEPDSPVQRYYQLKFKNDTYRCMFDLLLVDYQNKKIYPVDLKTSGHPEDEFPKSFIKWGYQMQARLYYRVLKDVIEKDDFFKDFEIEDFTFVVVNRQTLTPLTWRFKDTKTEGTLYYGNNHQIVCDDPYNVGNELSYYLKHPEVKMPLGIEMNRTNDLVLYLNAIN